MPLILSVLSFLSLVFLYPNKGLAYFNLMDTGELRQGQNTRALVGSQMIFNGELEGLNFNGRYSLDSSGLISHSEFQFEAAAGSVDYQLGAFLKWIPFPDTDNQPAVGVRTGFHFAKVLDYSTYGLNITPLVSKHINSDMGKITPYLGLPVGILQNTLGTDTNFQVAVGVEWSPEEWELGSSRGFNLLLEYGLGLSSSYGDSLSLAVAYDFE